LVHHGFEVHTITRNINRESVEKHGPVPGLTVHYLQLPIGLERLYSFSQTTMYLYYILWQWMAYRLAKKLNNLLGFHWVHHVSWGSIQLGSYLYRLNVPFIFGPVGGGQFAPEAFKEYFLQYWSAEGKRKKVSRLLLKYNPGCRRMLKRAHAVLVSNQDTQEIAEAAGACNIVSMLDAALPDTFFPSKFIKRFPRIDKIKLLWVGRFLPRKGILLTLEVMHVLKSYSGITLTIVGDGPMRTVAELKVHEYGLQDQVTFVGAVPFSEVRDYYANHDVFFFTSLRDSGPSQLIEAMAFNLPVVTLDLHGQGQIISPETGIKIVISTPKVVVQQLADAIVDLSNDPKRYSDLSRAAYLFAKKQTWKNKINAIVARFS
jgi:glycosyltransferase involved in cell wall biosynthesis